MEELNEADIEEIVRLIKERNTSAIMDDGEGKHISWTIHIQVWCDPKDV